MTDSSDTTIHYAIGELEGSHDFAETDRQHVVAFSSEEERDLWVAGSLEEPVCGPYEVRRAADREEAGEALQQIMPDGADVDPAELLEFCTPESYSETDLRFARQGDDD